MDVPSTSELVEFWQEAASEAKAFPLEYSRSVQASHETEHHRIETFAFRGIKGEALHGWIAAPHTRVERQPGFLWIPPYGRESVLPNEYGTRIGYVSLSFNFHGESAFHQETYVPIRGYFADGAESPETWIFRAMFQNAFLAMRILQQQVEVDEDRIAAMGMSQGAGISIWLGAWCPIVRAVCADMPFLGQIGATLRQPVYRYPTKELTDFAETIPMGMERLLHTVSLFDTAGQAAHCKVPTLVSLGEKDPSVRPPNAEAIFDAIPGVKKLVRYSGGHDWDPGMIEQNRLWLVEHLG